MFDRLPAQPIHSPVVGTRRRLGGRISTALLSIGLAVGLAVTAGPMIAPSAAVAATLTDESGGSIQYQEALSHAGETYSFSPGPAASVPFRPRASDPTIVDGAAPVAVPAAQTRTPSVKAIT